MRTPYSQGYKLPLASNLEAQGQQAVKSRMDKHLEGGPPSVLKWETWDPTSELSGGNVLTDPHYCSWPHQCR